MGLESKGLKELIRIRGKLLRKIAHTPAPSQQDRAELRELETWIDVRIKQLDESRRAKSDD